MSRASVATLARRSLLSNMLWSSPSPQQRTMAIFKSDAVKERYRRQLLKRKGRLWDVDPEEEKKLPVFQYASPRPLNHVYTWGMACYGALGVPEYLRPKAKHKDPFKTMHRPARCSFAERCGVTNVACGYGFTVFALKSKKYHIMGTGINSDGQLGYICVRRGHPLELLIQPMGITLPVRDDETSKAVQVAAGRAHTVVLTNDADVFTLGNNAYGQCGRRVIPDENYFQNRVVHKVKGPWHNTEDTVESIYCGQDHTIFRTSNGNLYSCGWGADGQTGVGHFDTVSQPTRVAGDISTEKIVKVATKADCVLALNESGDVFGWGNSEYGQFATCTEEQQVCTPIRLPLRGLGRIIDVACGGTICMVLNENHDVFVWGYGILGKGPKLDQSRTPVQIPNTLFGRNEFSPETVVTSITCGVHTNAAITSNGELYVWGKNKGSCLGLGDYKDQFFPLKVSMASAVTQVSMGVDHSAALCKPWA